MTDDRSARGLCEPFLEHLPITGASISVFDAAGRQSTICATDATAARLDELQLELGEGPNWEAITRGAPVLIDDVKNASLTEFPTFGTSVLALEVGALFAFPMVLGAVTVGVVGLYRARSGKLSPGSQDRARRLADRATTRAVRQALTSAAAESVVPEPADAPALRREVHQATGMILVQLDVSATEAFIRLRAHAFASGRSVQEVARDVVARTLDFRELS